MGPFSLTVGLKTEFKSGVPSLLETLVKGETSCVNKCVLGYGFV